MRRFISLLAKKLYYIQFLLLKSKLETIYSKIDFAKNHQRNEILTKFIISGEDHRFRYHFGFDLIAILRAIKNRIFYQKIEGASTIEQQLVRVLTNNFEKTLSRKIQEIFLSTTVCEIVPRKYIPIVYLNVAYFGANMNGLDQAIKKLGSNNRNTMDENLAAELVARIKYPEPKTFNYRITIKIKRRKEHLLNLYNRHNSRKFLPIYD